MGEQILIMLWMLCCRTLRRDSLWRLGGLSLTSQCHVQVLINGKRASRLDRNGPFNVSLEKVMATEMMSASKGGSMRLDIIAEAFARSNEGWRFDTKGISCPEVQWNGDLLLCLMILPACMARDAVHSSLLCKY